MRVYESARKHGVADEDMLHAARRAQVSLPSTGAAVLLAGPARDGTLLEVGVLDPDGDDPVIIHADRLRAKFYRFLRTP